MISIIENDARHLFKSRCFDYEIVTYIVYLVLYTFKIETLLSVTKLHYVCLRVSTKVLKNLRYVNGI